MFKYELTWEIKFSHSNKNYTSGGFDILESDKPLSDEDFTLFLDNCFQNRNMKTSFSKNCDYLGNYITSYRVKKVQAYYSGSNKTDDMEKLYKKIQKLINLSMSPNENEAKAAGRKAIELMEKNSISENDLDKHDFVIQYSETNYTKIPYWLITLFDSIGSLSGCYVVYVQGNSGTKVSIGRKAFFEIVGKERDVLNAIYLIDIIGRQVEVLTKEWQKKIKENGGSLSRKDTSSYKLGLINGVVKRLTETREEYFSTLKSENQIVPLNSQTKKDLSEDFYKQDNKVTSKTSNSQITNTFHEGREDSDKVSLYKGTENKSSKKYLK